jgi:transcriptional accessory protein Tex/SPT6
MYTQDLSGVVVSRRQLLDKGLMGPLTYTNAAAFLRIRKKGIAIAVLLYYP